MTLIIIIFVVAILFVIAKSLSENKKLSVEQYEIVSNKIPEDFENYRIVFLTDLHSNEFGFENELLLQKIDELNPNVILVGGDMIVARHAETLETTLDFMQKLASKYRVYYADGNHELRFRRNEEVYGVLYKEYIHQLKEFGVIHLADSSVFLDEGIHAIRLTALDLEEEQYRKFHPNRIKVSEIYEKVGMPDEDFFQILLAHNPNYFREYANWGADLVLAGHFHGGMVRLPGIGGVISPQMQIFPKFDAGEFKIGHSIMVLSRGLGNHSIKIRLWNYPEISLITLKKSR